MNVKELKELLADVDDDMEVLIPMTMEFDGYFKSPCVHDSGENSMGAVKEDGDEEEITSFILVPCGFFEPIKSTPELN